MSRSSPRRTFSLGLLAGACAAALAGCGYPSAGLGPAHMPTMAPLVAGTFLAAGDGDEAPNEIVEFYEHEGGFKPRTEPKFPDGRFPESKDRPSWVQRKPRKRRTPSKVAYRLGVRCGLFSPGEADYKWPETPYVGLFVRRSPRETHRMSAEIGGEFVKLVAPESGPGGDVFSRMWVLHANVLLGRMDPRGLAAYAVLGGQMIVEEADLYYERDRSAVGGGVEVGVGVGTGRGRWRMELRALYTEIMSSGRNTEDTFSVSFGVAF